MSKQVEWDAHVNARISQLQSKIDLIQAEKDSVDARLASLAGGSNADVIALRTELTNKSNRIASRLTSKTAERDSVSARLYASLSGAEQAIVDDVCTNRSEHVQSLLASTDVDISTFDSRRSTAVSSVTDSGALSDDDVCKVCEMVIQRMVQGL